MNKIILLSDTERMPKGVFEFALAMQERAPVLLTGVFVPHQAYWNTLLYFSYGIDAPLFLYEPEETVIPPTRAAISAFEAACLQHGIEYRVHELDGLNIRSEIQLESRFADLLLLGSEYMREESLDDVASDTGGNALHYAECPVIVAPEAPAMVRSVVIAYDGSPSSVYAMRAFTQVLPEMTSLETYLVYVGSEGKSEIPELALVSEFAGRHFSRLTIMKLEDESGQTFEEWMEAKTGCMLVSGAQGRGGFSEFFKRSFLNKILKNPHYPIFVTHR